MKRPDEPLSEAECHAAMQVMIDRIAELEAMMKSRGGIIEKPSDIII